jgi:Flp pilus assembly protein TadG
MSRLLRRLAEDDGAVTAEIAFYVPLAVLVVCLLWAFGATAMASSAVLHAALNASRAASRAPTATQARADASRVAQEILHEHDLRCRSLTVTVDTSGFGVPVGQPAQVSVEVTCVITLADLCVPGFSGEKAVRERQVSALDTFRTRT